MLHFMLLGSFGVTVDGIAAKVALPRRGIALLAYLLLQGNARVSRERLAVLLWPDESESDGRAKVRRMLYLIGQCCPVGGSADWFDVEPATVRWNASTPRTIDVEQLRSAIASAEPIDTTPIYRGDLLEDFEEEWAQAERERLRDGHVRNLERLARVRDAARDFGGARATELELLRLEPWREDVMRLVIGTRLASGDRGGALADYERFERQLREEFGVEPMAETLALRRQLDERPAPAAMAATLAPPAPPVATPQTSERIFVGRERELTILAESLRDAEAGRGSLVLIGGESGVGKSELLTRHARFASERGTLVITAGATFIATRPYQPFAAAFARGSSHLTDQTLSSAVLAARDVLLPDAPLAGPAVLTEAQSTRERARLFEGVAGFFEALANRAPLLLILEDLHWAGSDTIAMLEYVARRAARSRVSIVASYRDGDLPRSHPLRSLRRRLSEELLLKHVVLGPLQSREIERYFEAVHAGGSPEIAKRLALASGGLPIILVGLVEEAIASGGAASAIRLPGPEAVGKRATLAAKVDALPLDVRTLLEIAAVIGLGFDIEIVVEVSGWSEAEATRALGLALGRRVVRESPAGGYDFAHDLFRVIVYDAMPPAKRALRHALVAAALEELHPEHGDELAGELAMHYELAGDAKRAIVVLQIAARRAIAAHAYDEAVGYADRALGLGPADDQRLSFLLLREEARRGLGDRAGQRADLERCAEIAANLGDPVATAEVAFREAALDHVLHEYARELESLARSESAFAAAGGAWPAQWALQSGLAALELRNAAVGRPFLERAAREFEAIGDARGRFQTEMAFVFCERFSGDLAAIDRHFERAEAMLAAAGDADDLWIEWYERRTSVAMNRQRYAEAMEWADELVRAATAFGDIDLLADAYGLRGEIAISLLDFAKSEADLKKSIDLYERLGQHSDATRISGAMALLHFQRGATAEARDSFAEHLRVAREEEHFFRESVASNNLALSLIALGQFEEAERVARAGIEAAIRAGETMHEGMARTKCAIALRELGRPAEALPLLRTSCDIAERLSRPRSAAEAYSERALSAALVGESAEARASADRARAFTAALPEASRAVAVSFALLRAYLVLLDRAAAEEMAREGMALVRSQAARCTDDAARELYLTRFRRFIAAVEAM